MNKYHRIYSVVERTPLAGLADWLNPSLDAGQRRSLKALSSLGAVIKPSAVLWGVIQEFGEERIRSSLGKIRKSIRLAERAIREKDADAIGTYSESIRSELTDIAKFLSMAQSLLSAHNALPEYASAISSGLRHLHSVAA